MVQTLPAIAVNPLELAHAVPMQVVAAAVGALVGVALFAVIVLVAVRRRPRPAFQAAATDVVFIPPYAVAARPGVTVSTSVAPPSSSPTPRRPLGFVPSTALSARAFAKLGYSFAAPGRAVHEGTMSSSSTAASSEEPARPAGLEPEPAKWTAEVAACDAPSPAQQHHEETVALKSFPRLASFPAVAASPAIEVVPPTTSATGLAAAPIADLDLDDGPTQLCEPYFDEPPQPRRRVAPPKIRQVPPTPPRHPAGESEVERAAATLRWAWMPPSGLGPNPKT